MPRNCFEHFLVCNITSVYEKHTDKSSRPESTAVQGCETLCEKMVSSEMCLPDQRTADSAYRAPEHLPISTHAYTIQLNITALIIANKVLSISITNEVQAYNNKSQIIFVYSAFSFFWHALLRVHNANRV